MTVSADSAKDQVQTATTGLVNLHGTSRQAGGSLMYDGREQVVTGWHYHDVHEIEYACHGIVEVETEAGHYLARMLRSMALLAESDRSVLEVCQFRMRIACFISA